MPEKKPLPLVFAFDVFGTVVDWRTSIIAQTKSFLDLIGRSDLDSAALTDDWRGRYLGTMKAYASSGRGFVPLDRLHREMLEEVLRERGLDLDAIGDDVLTEWSHSWRRLAPWPPAFDGGGQPESG